MKLLAALLVIGAAGCGDDPLGPSLEAILPARAAVGASVELVGERFEGSPHGVAFGGQEAAILDWQARRARVVVPTLGPGHTSVVVMVAARRSAPLSFTVEGTVQLDAGR
jgi:hypothetical protein